MRTICFVFLILAACGPSSDGYLWLTDGRQEKLDIPPGVTQIEISVAEGQNVTKPLHCEWSNGENKLGLFINPGMMMAFPWGDYPIRYNIHCHADEDMLIQVKGLPSLENKEQTE